MMKTVAQLLMMVAVSEAARCRIKCEDPKIKNSDECKCECPASTCEEWQTQNEQSCGCEDKPCTPCAPGEGGDATADDFKQAAQPTCECRPADGMDPCDAKYGGFFDKNAAGEACPSDEGEAGEGEEGGEGEGSGAATIAAAGLTVLTALLI